MTASGTLYVVSLPIGNLGDITLRALDVLRTVDFIVAEDTRTTQRLLAHHQIATPMFSSYYQGVEKQRARNVLSVLASGKSVALVSDAGTPLISDPGYPLVCGAIERAVRVVPIPGPSALMAALVVAGFAIDRFAFEGAVPRTAGARARLIERLEDAQQTTILYESPHRLADTLQQFAEKLPERRIALARELTKVHEEVLRGTAAEVLTVLAERDRVRGEFVLVIDAATQRKAASQREAAALYRFLIKEGLPKRAAQTALMLAFGLPRNAAYDLVHREIPSE